MWRGFDPALAIASLPALNCSEHHSPVPMQPESVNRQLLAAKRLRKGNRCFLFYRLDQRAAIRNGGNAFGCLKGVVTQET